MAILCLELEVGTLLSPSLSTFWPTGTYKTVWLCAIVCLVSFSSFVSFFICSLLIFCFPMCSFACLFVCFFLSIVCARVRACCVLCVVCCVLCVVCSEFVFPVCVIYSFAMCFVYAMPYPLSYIIGWNACKCGPLVRMQISNIHPRAARDELSRLDAFACDDV